MLEIKNCEVWGLERAIKASGNAMTIGELDTTVVAFRNNEKEDDFKKNHLNRAVKLGTNPVGSAHDHFLVGVHVQFDIKYPSYWTIEAERYHNFEIITSQSTMHRLTTMGKDDKFEDMFNKYVDQEIIDKVKSHIEKYNYHVENHKDEDKRYELFMKCISNLPRGFEMWMTCDLTYLQLKTMYLQRRNHKLKEDWGVFCDWCERLPVFLELTGVKKKNELDVLIK